MIDNGPASRTMDGEMPIWHVLSKSLISVQNPIYSMLSFMEDEANNCFHNFLSRLSMFPANVMRNGKSAISDNALKHIRKFFYNN